MKYKINIEGGFIPLPQEFNGEVDSLQPEHKKFISQIINNKTASSTVPHKNTINDGFSYAIEVMNNKQTLYQQNFDELNLPKNWRDIIDSLKNK